MTNRLFRRANRWLQEGDELQRMDDLLGWYHNTPLGMWLREAEEQQLAGMLANMFGYHLLQVGSFYHELLYTACRIPHVCVLDGDHAISSPGDSVRGRGLVCRPGALPIESDSVDVVLLPHTLEYVNDPYQVLREVDRVLIPEGHVIILGFNPWSIWGLVRLMRSYRATVPWCGRFRSCGRIRDWLQLLGFDAVHSSTYFFRPPLANEMLMRRLAFMERLGRRYGGYLGGGYVLAGKKRVATPTPLRPRWRPRRLVVPADLVKPSARYLDKQG